MAKEKDNSIKLDEFYRIENDSTSWNLIYEKAGEINSETGKPKMSRHSSYHINLKHALVWYRDQALGDCASLAEVLARLDEIEANINTAI